MWRILDSDQDFGHPTPACFQVPAGTTFSHLSPMNYVKTILSAFIPTMFAKMKELIVKTYCYNFFGIPTTTQAFH